MFENILKFSMDLYTLDSSITVEFEADTLTINVNSCNGKISLWIDDGDVFPEIYHDTDHSRRMPLEMVSDILKIIEKHEGSSYVVE